MKSIGADVWGEMPMVAETKRARLVSAGPALGRWLLRVVYALAAVNVIGLLLVPGSGKFSNYIQLAAAALTVVTCLVARRRSTDHHLRLLWLQLTASFSVWTLAQGIYLVHLLGGRSRYSAMADSLWLLCGFLILLVLSSVGKTAERDRVEWLDLGQACISLLVVYALVFSKSPVLSVGTAYNVQDLVLVFACALRYSLAKAGAERRLLSELGMYLMVYGVCSWLGWNLPRYGFGMGSIGDLVWTLPFFVFCALVLQKDGIALAAQPADGMPAGNLPRHFRGLSAIGLTVTSITAACCLALQRPKTGFLSLAIAFMVFVARVVTRERQLQSAHVRLEQRALYDTLTGLGNRALLTQELSCALERPRSDASSAVAVLFVDLDRFKAINDSLGHAFGDRLLIAVANLLKSALRPQDLLARLGGDEFVVLLRGIDGERSAALIGERIVALLQEPIVLDERVNYVTASVGVMIAEETTTADEMLRNADCAMYAAKSSGKNGMKLFSPSMMAKTSKGLELETDLRKALQNRAIEVWYQPIYAVGGDVVRGFEALVRWRHPLRGMVPPLEFVPIAEDTGLILELGRQVLHQACTDLRAWNERFQSRLSVSVNISARQFADPRLLETITNTLQQTGLDPKLLKLEITESVLLSEPVVVTEVLTAARALGIEICLDDFGTGYSSLSYLLDFPFDVVKIDRSFVKNMEQDKRRMEMVRTIVQLVRQLDKQVIAEGVETSGELDCLRGLDCELVQGFLLSRPLAFERLSTILEADPVPCTIETVHEVHTRSPQGTPQSSPAGEGVAVSPWHTAAVATS